MSTKTWAYIGLSVGSVIGSIIPLMWGSSMLSMTSVFVSGLGSLIGVFAGLWIGKTLNGTSY